ncbi:MAG: hypothetical protein WKG32_10765 [Gemmatimonadaceae bacterium]
MALREFTDTAGRTWQVWDTVPETAHEEQIFRQSTRLQADAERRATDDEPGAAVLPNRRFGPGREGGWLTFMTSTSGGEDKRRLSPIPPGWADATEAELVAYMAQAEPVHLGERAARLLATHEPTPEALDREEPRDDGPSA